MPSQKKKELVDKLAQELQASQAVYLADYKGLNTQQFNLLRQKLKDSKAKMMVIKNRLFSRALAKIKKETADKLQSENILTGTLAAVFAYDDTVSPLKVISGFVKEINSQTPSLKAGFDQTGFISADDIVSLTNLPDKASLQAQVVGSLNAPIYGLVNSLSWPMKELVWVLDNIKKVKQN